MKLTKIIACAAVSAVAAASLAAVSSAYNGYLCFQTGQWCYRNAWDDASVGKDSDYYGCIIMNGGSADEGTYPDYEDYYDYDLGTYAIPVTWTDASISGAGTYTVAIDDFDWSLDGSSGFNAAYVSTDIPESAGLKPTSITVYIDGNAENGLELTYNGWTNFDSANKKYFAYVAAVCATVLFPPIVEKAMEPSGTITSSFRNLKYTV